VHVQEEFAAAHASGALTNASDAEVKKAFDLFDQDHDGYVTTKEIEKLCGNMDPVQAKQMIGEVDRNSDGDHISFGFSERGRLF